MTRHHDNRRRTFALAATCSLLVLLVAAAGAWASPGPDRAGATGGASLDSAPVHVLRPASGGVAGIWQALPGAILRASSTAAGDIFYSGFEESTPPWSVGDTVPTWALTDYRAAAGTTSAYCCGSTIQPPGPYANDMQSWLWTNPPIDLSGVTTATFECQFWLDSELQHDQFEMLVSVNATNFYGTGWWGNSGGWMTGSMDLTAVPTLGNVCGQSAVYLAFVFESDESTTAEGAYVDEVRVCGQQGPTITGFTPTSGPVGTTVTLAGTGFTGATGVAFNGVASTTFNVVDDIQMTAKVPSGATTGPISVTTPTGTGTSADSYTVTLPAKPKIAKLSPTAAKRGAIVTITGSNFGAKRGTSFVKFGTTKATKYVTWTAKKIKCKVPAKAKFGKLTVRVTTRAGVSNGKTFKVKR